MSDNIIQAPQLQSWTARLFEAMGVAQASAQATAESLVDADLRGIGTHGVVRVPIYVKRLQLGLINKTPTPRFHSVGGAAQRLDGDNGLGQWVGLQAMERACELAQTAGIAMVLATRSNHFGTAGWFARKAAARGCAALVWSQSESMVVPFGGTQRFFGTNPFCMAMPRPQHDPIVLDMATSVVPYGKIEVAKVTTGEIPSDWAVDESGKPTTDPHQVHALQPMSGPKGSGLAMMIDLLSGALAGDECGPRLRRLYDDFEDEQNQAHTFIAIKADAFSSGRAPSQVIEEMVDDLHKQEPGAGFDEILLPGEIEARNAARQSEQGLTLAPALIESLREIGTQFGEELPL